MKINIGLGLGSNIGDRIGHIKRALTALSEQKIVQIEKISSFYRTVPWGPIQQADYANLCALGFTYLAPHALLEKIKGLELFLGRFETVRWGPRIIDIDILFYGEEQLVDQNLILPHKALFERAFVLLPLDEIAPDLVIGGRKISDVSKTICIEGISLWQMNEY